MKTLKFIFFTFLLSTFIYSCTPEEVVDNKTSDIGSTQATGDESNVDNGSKD